MRSQARILWVTRAVTPQFCHVYERLSRDGLALEVHILAEGSRGRGWGDLPTSFPHRFVSTTGFKALVRGLKQGSARGLGGMVVFGYNSSYAIGLLLAAKIWRVPVFTQSDSSIENHLRRPVAVRLLKALLLRTVYPRSTRVWVIGASNAAFWRAQGLSNHRHIPFESPVPTPEHVRRPAQPPIILFVGRLAPEKRVHDAFNAVELLRQSGTEVRLRMVGQGELSTAIGAAEVPDWLEAVGPIPHRQLGNEYQEASVLVLPSESEAYGLVVREALQFGLPVVGTDRVTAIQELCDQGWNRAPVGNIEALTSALARALEEPRWRVRPPIDVSALYREELDTCLASSAN